MMGPTERERKTTFISLLKKEWKDGYIFKETQLGFNFYSFWDFVMEKKVFGSMSM